MISFDRFKTVLGKTLHRYRLEVLLSSDKNSTSGGLKCYQVNPIYCTGNAICFMLKTACVKYFPRNWIFAVTACFCQLSLFCLNIFELSSAACHNHTKRNNAELKKKK